MKNEFPIHKSRTSSLIQLKRAQALLNSFNAFRSARIVRSRELLARFAEVDLARGKEGNISNAKQLLNRYHLSGLHSFKIFRIAGFSTNEKNLSDAIQAILDPNQTHGLGVLPLMSVLNAIRHRAPRKISFITKELSTKDFFIIIEREENAKDTIPDISITGRSFLIFIENKKRGGTETFLHNKYQTQRQWKQLVLRGKKMGISENGILGIYFTPEGYSAKDQNFIPLHTREFVSAIREAVNMNKSCSCRGELCAFLDYYNWE